MTEGPASRPEAVSQKREPSSEGIVAPRVARWFHDHAEDLQRFLAKRRVIESDIKDVCQEVYLRLLRFERTEVVKNPQAYLFRVAANVAHDFKLRQPQGTAPESEQLEVPASEPGPEQLAEAAFRRRCLMTVLATLPPLPRAALALQAQEDLTYDEIAARLGVTRRVVKRAIARGYALAREALFGVI